MTIENSLKLRPRSTSRISSQDILRRLRQTIAMEAHEIQRLSDRVDENSVLAVEHILDTKGRVILVGMGKSGLIGRKIAATLCSTGTPAFFLHAAEALHGDLGLATPDDTVLALSASGETAEIVNLLPLLRRIGVYVISMTAKRDSALGKRSDLVLEVSVNQEAGPLGIAPMSGTTAMLAMGDALAAALMEARGLTREEFAIFHPGGCLGRKLLLRVSDLMHRGEAMPLVQPNVQLRTAICEMSNKRLGTILVESASRRLTGIFTDGDLRRLMSVNKNPLSMRVSDVMTRQPKTIGADCLAIEALQAMKTRAITVLPVVRHNLELEGVIHLHDLVRAGLV